MAKPKKTAKKPRIQSSQAPWKDMKKFEQLSHLTDHVQNLLNQDYLDGTRTANKAVKFETQQSVLCLMAGLYYKCTVSYYRMSIPETLYPRDQKIRIEEMVLTYLVWRDGWPRHIDNDLEAPENELIPYEIQDPIAVVGMLCAHCWNTWKQTEFGYSQKDMGPGVFFLDATSYTELEIHWRAQSGQTTSFEQFYQELYAESLRTSDPNSPSTSNTSFGLTREYSQSGPRQSVLEVM